MNLTTNANTAITFHVLCNNFMVKISTNLIAINNEDEEISKKSLNKYVVKKYVNTIWCNFAYFFTEIDFLIIKNVVKSKFIFTPFQFLIGSNESYDSTALN